MFDESLKDIPSTGFMREKQVFQFIPVSRSAWWAGVSEGRYPKPVKLGPRTTAWKVQDIRDLIERLSSRNET